MYITTLIRWRRTILLIWACVLLAFAGVIVNKLFLSSDPSIDNSVGIWFNKTDPDLITYENYNDTFGEKEWSILLLQTDSIYSPEFLSDLDSITEKISELSNVVKITSITNVRDNFLTDDGSLDYRRLYSDQVPNDSKALQEFQDQLKRNPIFERNLILKNDETSTALLIQNDNFINDPSEYRIQLVNGITNIVNEHASINNFALAGTTVVNAELNRASKRDVFVFYSLITVLLTFIGFYILKSLRNLLVMYSVVVTSSIPAMGMLAALNIPYNMITVMLPTILIALSVAGVVHIITEFHLSRFEQTSEAAIATTLSRLLKPTVWTTVTTIAGFSSFTTSNVFPVFQLGLFSAVGLFLAGVANLVIAPLLLLMLWPDRIQSPELFKKPNSLNRWHNSNGFRFGILLCTLILLLPAFSLPRLEVDTNYIKFFSESHPTSQSYDLIKKVGFAQNPIVLQLKYSDDLPYSASQQIRGTVAFEKALKALPEVVKILSATDFLEEINKAFNDKEAQPLDRYNKAQIEQLLLLGELSGNDDLSDFILSGATDVQIIVMTQYMSSRELDAFKDKLFNLQNQLLPKEVHMDVTGTTTLWANMDTQVSNTQFYSLLFITLFLLVLLPMIFGSFTLGMIGLAVNILPLAITLGCMAFLDIKINIATALIGGISLGVVVDDTIHFISRIIQNQKSGQSIAEAVENSIQTIGKSIIYTTLILIVGFSCMASSNFLPSAHFGIFISLSIFLALLLDLFCVPALLKSFPELTKRRNLAEQS